MFGPKYITFEFVEDTFPVVNQDGATKIHYSENEHESVKRAIQDLQKDIFKVTSRQPELKNSLPKKEKAIVIGTLGTDDWLEKLISKVDLENLKGKWESFLIQTIKVPQFEEILVIVGSDNRGAIYGIYDLVEKMGVSPWYWWMDVPILSRSEVYVKKGSYFQGEPSVQYRGFFLNDEGPSLMTWVRKNYPDFTHEFYEKIFELTLRLKANYHWPAMWDSTFYEDDEKNIVTANRYGVVIGTSHHEPMNRPHGDWKKHKKGPWDYHTNRDYLYDFWREGIERSKNYETIINLGMRGDGDEAMEGNLTFEEKSQLLEKIVEDQRKIIKETHNDKKLEEVPQLWALYKEVKDYYDAGMTVPDDVTLLWGDDNFGNIRRLPTESEQSRKGGAGIYYHLDYVGGPRNYKWVNTVPIEKIWEQMHKSYAYNATKIWILNVGDLKPMEFQMEFFLRMAWNVDDFSKDSLWDYSVDWANYYFGEEFGLRVAKIIHGYSKQNGRIKPEMLNGVELYSHQHYQEAERILNEFEEIIELAEELMNNLPEEKKDTFFQVAYYPAKASFTVLKLHLLAEKSKLYSEKERSSANVAAREAELLFLEDKMLAFDYNKRTALGKWNHMMDQIHIGYTYWQQPEEQVMPEVTRYDRKDKGEMDVNVVGNLTTNVFTKREMAVDIYNKGKEPIEIKIESQDEWIQPSLITTKVINQVRITFSIDWKKVPNGENVKGTVVIYQLGTPLKEKLRISVYNPSSDKINQMKGFVPVDGVISIEAEHYSRKKDTKYHSWETIPKYGRTMSSMGIFPVKTDKEYSISEAPILEYDVYFPSAGKYTATIFVAPSLDFTPERGLRLGVTIDEEEFQIIDAVQYGKNGSFHESDWEKSVIYNIRELKVTLDSSEAGNHVIKVAMVDPQVIIQKIILDLGGLQPSYLGPPETPQVGKDYSPISFTEIADYNIVPGNVAFAEREIRIFAEKSGLYRFDGLTGEMLIDSIPLLKQKDTDEVIYHLTSGYHKIAYQNWAESRSHSLSIELIDEDRLVIRPSLRSSEEIIVQLGFLNIDQYSHSYKIKYRLLNEKKQLIGEDCIIGVIEKEGKEMLNKCFEDSIQKGEYKLEVEWETDKSSRKQHFYFKINN
ncbi:glycosyl hydrolase 115 family protein [Jeotgalibaca ciconiae]|uniref:Glycosyl hydrolase n=1 Tax=Jeotgalibaca ciconiae TaxID=2496265 RepID=A0A3Q9BJ30_9LACT|nr:glycosyl hydrolase 115 family protein [Jeotgalibaca ciconiae]AZP03538.1 glycosyl hydrolase [Jeotgalibaca ciconiae]